MTEAKDANMNFLDFEQPIAELDAKIQELRYVGNDKEININDEITRLQKRSNDLITSIFSSLSAWQISQVSRHPARPCHQKGRDTRERIFRNYGMPRPEGYRKALRIMKLAEKFNLPLFTFIDTPGAYPGIGAEERGQNEAISRNLMAMSELGVPIISTIIGEGGSGGALAIGVSDTLLMLQYSTYSVISPEGCASILWKSADKAADAAEAMGITAQRLYDLGLVDVIVDEPLGGAHRDYEKAATLLKQALQTELEKLQAKDLLELVSDRQYKIRNFGSFDT
ncbi:MAG: acetyl-CoA carboxylase carboxyltransferase subunit alpha [Gammaproteobacteria bacterium]